MRKSKFFLAVLIALLSLASCNSCNVGNDVKTGTGLFDYETIKIDGEQYLNIRSYNNIRVVVPKVNCHCHAERGCGK
jgi:predicted small secreted protein